MLANLALAGLGVAAGAMLGTQASINAMVSRSFGSPVIAVAISFCFGSVVLVAMSAVVWRMQGLGTAWRGLPPWSFFAGGTLGVIYLVSAVFLTPRIGVAATMGLIIAGQLVAGLLLDRLGLFGLSTIGFTIPRIGGAILLVGGALLMRFG